jgi:hypothetical protein
MRRRTSAPPWRGETDLRSLALRTGAKLADIGRSAADIVDQPAARGSSLIFFKLPP